MFQELKRLRDALVENEISPDPPPLLEVAMPGPSAGPWSWASAFPPEACRPPARDVLRQPRSPRTEPSAPEAGDCWEMAAARLARAGQPGALALCRGDAQVSLARRAGFWALQTLCH